MTTAISIITTLSAIIATVVTVLTYLGVKVKIGRLHVNISPVGFKRAAQSLALGVVVGLVVLGIGAVAVAAFHLGNGATTTTTSTTTTSTTTTSTSTTTTTIPTQTVKITSLRPGQQVPIEVSEIRGTSTGLRPGQEIWVVVISAARYYPQDGPVIVEPNGNWMSQPVFFGIDQDVGQTFYVLAVLANSKAGKFFDSYIGIGNRTGNFPGINRLPAGAVEYHRVAVIRR